MKTIDDLILEEGFNEECEQCQYYKAWVEWHPYGSTVAGESLADCQAPEDDACPRLKVG